MNQSIPYDVIRNTAPDVTGKRIKPRRKLKAWQGLLYFAVVFAAYLFFGGILFLLTGNIILEVILQQLFFLASAVLAVFIFRGSIREVFPLKKPKAGAVGGVFVLLIAFFLLAYVYSMLAMYFAPDSMESASESLEELFEIRSVWLEILLAAVSPAICEEAMFRGVVLHSFNNSFRKWTAILLSAVMFGAMHITPVRMFMPAVLGIVLGLLVLETGNMFYGSLLHFSYNASLTLISRWAVGITEGMEDVYDYALNGTTVGLSVMSLGMFIPFLLWLGVWLVRRSTAPRVPDLFPKGELRKTLLLILLPTCGIIFLGIVVFLS